MMNELAGAWRLKGAKWTFDDGGAVDLYGPGPQGRLLFTADGWMTALIVGPGAPSPDGGAAAPFNLAYSGRYRTQGDQFVTEVDVASMPAWLGTEQARAYEIADDVLSITLGMPIHPSYPDRSGRGKLTLSRE